MKYAALIFGDDDRHQPKKAAEKSSPEPGQIVRSIDGSVFRVASKIAGPDGIVVKLANLQGKSVQTPQNFRPIGIAVAHFASWLKYHLAYRKDFDLYINSYIEKHNQDHAARAEDIRKHIESVKTPKERKFLEKELAAELAHQLPYPTGHDGQAFRWANWFQSVVSPKLFVPGRGTADDKQAIKDELIHETLFATLGQRRVLDQFISKAESFGGGVNKENAGKKLTDFLIRTFMYRIDEMQNKLKEQNPEEEISMYQPGVTDESEGEVNILETEEYGVGESEFQSAEARKDVGKFRESFRKWLLKPGVAGEKGGANFILMFDIFWRLLQDAQSADDVKRNELENEWMDKTGLSFGSFKDYFTRLPEMVENFITTHGTELGDTNIFIDLMNTIRKERAERTRKERRRKERARPAMVSSLVTAGIEGDFAEAISNSENPDVVDKDIQQPTDSVSEAAKVSADEDAPNDPPGYAKRVRELESEGMTTSDAQAAADAEFAKTAGGVKRMMEEHDSQVLLDSIRPGDRVTILVPAGMGRNGQEYAERTGRAVIVSPGHVALNMGGTHGTPGVATVDNIVSVRKAKSGSSKIAQTLVRGDQLDENEVKQVRDAFIYRWTSDNQKRVPTYLHQMGGECPKCDIRNPYVNEQSAEGHPHPTISLQTDEQWLKEHAFYFTNAGKLLPRQHAVPAYLAPDAAMTTASVAHKFAIEKAAYNPGAGQYMYQADLFCEDCGGGIKRMLDKKGYTPQNPSDESSYDSDRYPKGPYYNQEADGPQHCSRCGKFLENPLTTEGYRYLNQMILEADEDGKGNDEIIQEWKAFYTERESDEYVPDGAVTDALGDVEGDTDTDFLKSMNTSSKKGMLGHDFNDADGQAITNETQSDTGRIPHAYDQTELTQPRMAAFIRTAAINVSQGEDAQGFHMLLNMNGREYVLRGADADAFRREYAAIPKPEGRVNSLVEKYMNKLQPYGAKPKPAPQAPAKQKSKGISDWGIPSWLRKKEQEEKTTVSSKHASNPMWKCEDCGQEGGLDPKGGGCPTCGSQAVSLVPPQKETAPEVVRETSPIETEKRMIQRRAPKPLPLSAGKTAQGSGNTTVTMQNQNVTNPNMPGKSEPMAVPEAIDQTAGPHSPNAPMTAPRTPGINPKVVNVPAGTEAEGEVMASAKAGGLEDIFGELLAEYACPRCNSVNVDVTPTEEGYDVYCEDCEQVTHNGGTVPASGGMGEHAVEPEFIDEGLEMEPEEPPFDEHEAAGDPLFAEQQLDTVGDLDVLFHLPQEKKEEWLVAHGWVKDESWHGASWWMQHPMWSKTDHEEDIPYQDTDDAMQKEVELTDAEEGREDAIGQCQCGEPLNNAEGDQCGRCQAEGAEDREDPFDKAGAGSNSGEDDARGVGDLYRENFYEHRTEGLSSEGMLSGMKEGAGYKTVDEYAAITAPEVLKNYVNEGGNIRDTEAVIAYTRENYRPEPLLVAAVMRLLPPKTAEYTQDDWERDQRADEFVDRAREAEEAEGEGEEKEAAAVAPAPAPLPPNVQQQMNIAKPPMAGPTPGATMAIMPGQGEEEQGGIKRHTVEPELPNAKYHMQGALPWDLVAAEEERLTNDPNARVNEYLRDMAARGFEPVPETVEALTKKAFSGQSPACRECGEIKPDVMWHEFPDLGNIQGTGQLEGYYCDDCALGIAQDI